MPFQPLNLGARGRQAAVALDAQHRLRLSAAALKELKLSAYQYVVISIDVENKRIGVAKQELAKVPNASAIKIDKRGYLGTSAGKNVVAKLGLTDGQLPCRFEYIGKIDEGGVYWSAFELTDVR